MDYEYTYPDFSDDAPDLHDLQGPNDHDAYTYAPLEDAPDALDLPHDCTADCFTFAERASDPTIDTHFSNVGPHKCDVAHGGFDR